MLPACILGPAQPLVRIDRAYMRNKGQHTSTKNKQHSGRCCVSTEVVCQYVVAGHEKAPGEACQVVTPLPRCNQVFCFMSIFPEIK